MNVRIEPSWGRVLAPEFEQPYFRQLTDFVRQEYRQGPCYPPGPDIFAAFDLCPFEQTKVVILGQDPYHEPGQAEGLCFSVKQGVAMPPSLVNIFRELQSDLGAEAAAGAATPQPGAPPPFPASGSLRRWASQGVLLLNATLTVRAHYAGSHQRHGWEQFTDAAIRALAHHRRHVVYLLWGAFARSKASFIPVGQEQGPDGPLPTNLVLQAAHPSPLSANRGGWFGCRHFSQANAYLRATGQTPIRWMDELRFPT